MPYKPLDGGVHSTTFDAEVRNVSVALISFMGFPDNINAHYSHFKSTFTIANIVN